MIILNKSTPTDVPTQHNWEHLFLQNRVGANLMQSLLQREVEQHFLLAVLGDGLFQ
jgi:hypothetical protein